MRPRQSPAASEGESSGRLAHDWTQEESDRAWDDIGDRLMDATRDMRRSSRVTVLQREVYIVNGRQLSVAQIDALEALVERPRWWMNELAQRLHVNPSNATRAVEPLVRLGLADRSVDPDNRRYVIVRATEQGHATASRIADDRRGLMRRALADMAPDRRRALTELLEEVLDHVESYSARQGN